MTKKEILLGLVLVSQLSLANSVGIGYGKTSEVYKGVDKGYTLPFIDFEYDKYFIKSSTANTFQLGYNVVKDDIYTFSIYALPLGGYKVKASDLDVGYQTVKDRDHKLMLGTQLKVYNSSYDVETSVKFEGGEEGGTAVLSLNKPYVVNYNFVLIPSVNLSYYNSSYVDYYFGVSGSELGGKLNSKYDGESAYSFGVNLTGNYKMTDSISILGFVGLNKLSNEISDSPLVENSTIYMCGAGIVYTF